MIEFSIAREEKAAAGATPGPRPGSDPDEIAAALRAHLDTLTAQAHARAFELLSDGSDAAAAHEMPVRVAIYRSSRLMRSRESEVRRNFVESRIENFLRPLNDESATHGTSSRGRELSLMDDLQLEHSVICASLAVPSEPLVLPRLRRLSEALAKVNTPERAEAACQSLVPRLMLEGYLKQIAHLDLEPEVRVSLLQAVEATVLQGMGGALQGMLEQLGVTNLPSLPARGTPAANPSRNVRSDEGDGGADTGADGERLVASLLQMLAGRALTDNAVKPDGHCYSEAEVSQALVELQAALASSARAWSGFEHETLIALIEQQLRATHEGRAPHRLAEAHAAIADLVDLVFQFVVLNGPLKEGEKTLLAKLKIPYLRIALVDRHLFAQPRHVARRWLEGLVESSTTQDPGPERALARPLREQLRNDVTGVLACLGEDVTQLCRHIAQLQETRDKAAARANVLETRVRNTFEGKEKLRIAWHTASRTVRDVLHGEHCAPVAEQILRRPWAQYLALLHARGAHRTPAWEEAVATALALVRGTHRWHHGATLDAGTQPRGWHCVDVRELLRVLRVGLSFVGYSEHDVKQLWRVVARAIVARRDLRECPTRIEEVLVLGHTVESAMREYRLSDLGDLTESTSLEPETVALDDTWLKAAAHVPIGTWMELREFESPVRLVKLSWRGIASRKLLFVNASGSIALEIHEADLARRLADESLVQIGAVSPVGSALSSIFRNLSGNS